MSHKESMLNIAVIMEGTLHAGGGYQQQLSTILELQKLNKYKITVFVFSPHNQAVLDSYGVDSVVVKNNVLDKIFRFINRQDFFYSFSAKFKMRSLLEKKMDENDIDLVYFLSPSMYSMDLIAHNFIFTNWDLCHRDFPEFSEVSFYREFEQREILFSRSLRKAVATIVDSPLARDNVVRRYGVDPHRVFPVSFNPSKSADTKILVDTKEKHGVSGEYIYYPAQFWSHKNHTYIIDALALLKEEGINLTAIFSGSNPGNVDYVLKYAKFKNVTELVKYIGFAPNEDIYSLYKNAIALVMPSYFGPTNIPPLEAFSTGTPVICSDLEGPREQVAEAALLCDLHSPLSLAGHLKSLLNSSELRRSLVEKGQQRLEELQKNSITKVLENIFDDYAKKLNSWKNSEF